MPVQRMQVCLNGKRSPAEHLAVPVTPAELAASAAEAVTAGAEAIHMHPRGTDGAESLRAADIGAAVAAVRAACPGTPVGVSTGVWITAGDPAARHAAIRTWADLPDHQRPDYASLNLSEPGSAELPALLESAGIATEAGVWSETDTALLDRAEPQAGWLRIMVEILDTPADAAIAATDGILGQLSTLGPTAPVLVHGENESCWPLIAHAGALGLPARIGLEDVTVRPDGTPAAGNAELVRLGLAAWAAASL